MWSVDVSECTVSGRGVQPTGLRVNDLAVFHVSTLNASQGHLDVRVTGSHGHVPVSVVKVGISFVHTRITHFSTVHTHPANSPGFFS